MYVLGNEREVVLIAPVEIPECYDHIKQGVVLLLSPLAFRLVFFAFEYIVVMGLLIYAYGPVYPYRKRGKKLLVFFAALFRELGLYFVRFKINDFLWGCAEYRVVTACLVLLTGQHNLWQEENDVFCRLAIAIPDILECISATFPQDKIIIYRLWAQKSSLLDKKSTEIVEKLKEYYHLSEETVENIKNNKNTKIDINKYVDKDFLFTWPNTTLKETTHNFCEGLKSQIAILVDGTVIPCCLDDEGKISLGNIFAEDLATILNKDKTKKIIKGFQGNKCVEKLCQSCQYKNRFK